jgi:hypothetical protein
MSNRPSDGSNALWGGPTLLSVTRIAVTTTSQTLAALLAAGTTTPPFADNKNPLTGLAYTAPYVDEQIKSIAFVGLAADTLYIGLNNAASSGVAAIVLATSLQPGVNQIPCNQSVGAAMQLKGSANFSVDVYQFG